MMQEEGEISGQQYLSILITQRAPKTPPSDWHSRDLHHRDQPDSRRPATNQSQRTHVYEWISVYVCTYAVLRILRMYTSR